MIAIELLNDLEEKGVGLWEDEGKLRFRAPKGIITDEIKSLMVKKKQEILEILKNKGNFPSIKGDLENFNAPFPVTDLQGAYYVGRSASGQSKTACSVYFEFENTGIDIEKFTSAWNDLVERHDMLRAVFLPDGTQKILEEVPPLEIEVVDLTETDSQNISEILSDLRNQVSHRIKEADSWPLFEIKAVRLPEEKVRIYFSIDMLIADFFSIQILFKELYKIYDNPDIELPKLDVSFRDYVMVLEDFKKSEPYINAKKYWTDRLGTLPPAPDLPVLHKADLTGNAIFKRKAFVLLSSKWLKIKDWGAKKSVTPSVILLAAYSYVLAGWSRRSKFCINLTLFNRLPVHKQVENLVGDFTTVILTEVDVSSVDSFITLTKKIQNRLYDDMDNRHFSGVQVIRELARTRGEGASGHVQPVVFTSIVGLEDEELDEAGADFLGETVYSITRTPNIWLDHQVTERNGELRFNWDFVEGIFPEGLMEDMFGAYCHILEKLAEEEPFRTGIIGMDDLMPESQKEVRRQVNSTDGPASDELLHTLFEKSVEKYPNNTALVSSGMRMSYNELSLQSDKIAGMLREKGTGPGKQGAVIMKKGWEQVVAVLGILKAGAAYIPIDSDLPEERIKYLLEASDVSCVLTQTKYSSLIMIPEEVNVIFVDHAGENPDDVPRYTGNDNKPEDPAYVIYTSGSTGVPKGVVTDHRGAVNTIIDINKRFGVKAGDSVLALSNLDFDLSVYDIFGILAAGGTIVMPEHDRLREPGPWLELMEKENVTVWNSAPVLMRMLSEYIGKDHSGLNDLKVVLLSGDWIPVTLPDEIRSFAPNADIISLGGATEASIWSVFYPVKKIDPEWKSIPYGKPLTNQHMYVLNEFMEECPDWVTGDIYIGGVGLAKGYFRDEEKTEESFRIHKGTGERLYRTGDLGRYLPDGTIEFLGREDFQVKIRGHRIELGEIESVLREHSEIKEAVVTAEGEMRGNKRLVGHIIPASVGGLYVNREADQVEIESIRNAIFEFGSKAGKEWPVERIDASTYLKYYEMVEDQSFNYMCGALAEIGLFIDADEKYTIDRMIEKSGIHPKNRLQLLRWLELLEREGYISRNRKDEYRCIKPLSTVTGEDHIEKISRISEMLDYTEYMSYLKVSKENLAGILHGEVDPLELLFPGATTQRAESVYKRNPLGIYANNIVKEIMKAISKKFSEKKRLKVLEVGAGTGITAEIFLPVFQHENTTYTFTDISVFFTTEAKKKFSHYPFVEYGILDINKDPVSQGFEEHGYDVILAANVLHNSYYMNTVVEYMKTLLSPGGYFVVLEQTGESKFLMISMEFLLDLNKIEDDRKIYNTAFLHLDAWRKMFSDHGFEDFMSFPEAGDPKERLGQHVFVVRAPSSVRQFDRQGIIGHLKRKLPDYMIPRNFNVLKEFPLNAAGKIDRKSLQSSAAGAAGGSLTADDEAPRNDIEERISALWKEVLDLDSVGIHDNFFEAGGDSLLAIHLVTRVCDEFERIDRDLIIGSLYENPTIASMAEFVQHIPEGSMIHPPLIVMKSKGLRAPFFWMHDGTGTLFVYKYLTPRLQIDRPLYGFQINDAGTLSNPSMMIREMAEEYAENIQRVQPQGPYNIGGFCIGGILALETARTLKEAGEKIEKLAIISSYKPPILIDDEVFMLPYLFTKEFFIPEDRAGFEFNATEVTGMMRELRRLREDGSYGKSLSKLLEILFESEPFRETPIATSYKRMAELTLDMRLKRIRDAAMKIENHLFHRMDLEELKSMFQLFKTSIAAVTGYEFTPYGDEILLFYPLDYIESYQWFFGGSEVILASWREVAGDNLRAFEIPGTHQTCLDEPHVDVLAKKLNSVLIQP